MVKPVSALEHGASKSLKLLLNGYFERGANQVIETLHRVLQHKSECGNLPPTLFLQFDNCTLENKNRYAMAYLDIIFPFLAFEEVYASFLTIGHTHSDIYQCFSRMLFDKADNVTRT